jgi:hypothetical protein
MTTSGETLNCHVDKEVVVLVDKWRFEHPMQPSRRIAVRALIKMALRGIERQKQATAKAAATTTTAGEQTAVVS